jgi:thiamine pyrophosphate-dependent acetolactate synthase large subunit-like protein
MRLPLLLGWGTGAALGVKQAALEKTVVATFGEGASGFGCLTAAHFVPRSLNCPDAVAIL